MKVQAPNKNYTGVSASVAFCNGMGETDDPHLLEWFRDHGYEVEAADVHEGPPEEESETDPEKKKAASKKAGE